MKKLTKVITLKAKILQDSQKDCITNIPTANLKLPQNFQTRPGVYLSLTTIKNKNYLGLVYCPPKYLNKKKLQTAKIHLFNFKSNLYPKTLSLKLTHFLRSPQTPSRSKQLKHFIKKDFQSLDNYIILVNRKDQIIGVEEKKTAHLKKAKLHRAISVQIFNSRKEWLIQQRSKSKMLWPLYWANTVCTDVRPYETYLQAAHRRLKEEFGLTANLKFKFQFTYHEKYKKVGSEREIDHTFTAITDQKPKPNQKEIKKFQYLPLADLKNDVGNQPQKYTPWFKLILKRLETSDILSS